MNNTYGFQIIPDWMYQKQREAVFHEKLYGVVEASTKAGKTVSHLHWLIGRALQSPRGKGDRVWWIAPTYKQAKIAWERATQIYPYEGFISNHKETDLSFSLPNGCTFECRSADKAHNLYGEDVWAIVMDEASRMGNGDEIWMAVQSVTTFTRKNGGGHVRIIGNVSGKDNWAYRKAREAEQGSPDWHYAELTAKDAVEAGVLSQDDIDQARRESTSEAEFMQLYFNVPLDNEYNPFGADAIEKCLIPDAEIDARTQRWTAEEGTPIVFGLDLARKRDYTVAIGLDRNGNVVSFLRTKNDWETQKHEISEVCGGVPTLLDATGIGDVMLPELEKYGVDVEPFVFTSSSKGELVRGLVVAIRDTAIHFPDGQITKELRDFEFKSLPSGAVRYEAPRGGYDDCVMALALAWRKMTFGIIDTYGPVTPQEMTQFSHLRLVS